MMLTVQTADQPQPHESVYLLATDSVLGAPINANRMRKDQYALLKASVQKSGIQVPLIVRPHPEVEGSWEVIDGHHRRTAAGELTLPHLPCIIRDLETGDARLAALAINRLRGQQDLGTVAEVFSEVLALNEGIGQAELQTGGFSAEEVDELLALGQDDSTQDALAGADASEPEAEEPEEPKVFAFELEFDNQKQYRAARRALQRAAGKGNPLSAGLLRVLEIE